MPDRFTNPEAAAEATAAASAESEFGKSIDETEADDIVAALEVPAEGVEPESEAADEENEAATDEAEGTDGEYGEGEPDEDEDDEQDQ